MAKDSAPSENAGSLKGPMTSHLMDENAKHKATVESVYSKWLGEGSAERCNEGYASQMALEHCKGIIESAQSVAPQGRMLDVPRNSLQDRVYSKYGKGEGKGYAKPDHDGEEMVGSNKSMLSNRKVKK